MDAIYSIFLGLLLLSSALGQTLDLQVGECNGVSTQCFADPCAVTSCPSYPNAKCSIDYCNCQAIFMEGNSDVTSMCRGSEVATSQGQPDKSVAKVPVASTKPCSSGFLVQCIARPCDVTSCPSYPSAECRDNYCESCNAEFWQDGVEVTSSCDAAGSLTPNAFAPDGGFAPEPSIPSMKPAKPSAPSCELMCILPPCQLATCPNYPMAQCRNEYCNACQARFFYGGQEVTSSCRMMFPAFGSSSRHRLYHQMGSNYGWSYPQVNNWFLSPWAWLFEY